MLEGKRGRVKGHILELIVECEDYIIKNSSIAKRTINR